MVKTSSKLLTVFEAESRTGRKASTWRRDILFRRVPYVKIGRSVRIPEEAVDALIAQGWRDPVLPVESAKITIGDLLPRLDGSTEEK